MYSPISPHAFDGDLRAEPIATVDIDADDELAASSRRSIVCARCRASITEDSARREVNGASRHTFANPAGVIYQIVCFGAARGALSHGPATEDYSWFPRWSWTVVYCASCLVHLGWRYERSGFEPFFGLIEERLIEEPD